ncbi:MAG: AAA family ATPase [Sphaerochaetaceae bacterium]|nr:AAA family ATPase [Sphaerochaetaceae bacterium]
MKTIAVTSVKGGCGKTSSSVALAQVLSQTGSKVLLVDLDPQASATAHMVVEENPEYDYERTIREVLLGEIKLEDILIHPWEKVAFAPADLRLQNIEVELASENNPIFLLNDILEEVVHEYDYTIIDTSPNTGLMTRSALTAADYVLCPVLLEGWPVLALDLIFQMIEGVRKSQKYIGKNIERILIAPNFYVDNLVVTRSFHYALRQGYTDYLSETVIHRTTEISQVFAQPQAKLKEGSRPYQEYLNLVNELLEGQKDV